MPTSLFVNLPIADLQRSIDFFSALGFAFNPKFSNQDATCLVISEHIQVMLLTTPFFAGFTRKPVADAHASGHRLRHQRVDFLARFARQRAATPMPVQDHGFMYQHGFEDLDGHLWEVFWMNEAEFQQA